MTRAVLASTPPAGPDRWTFLVRPHLEDCDQFGAPQYQTRASPAEGHRDGERTGAPGVRGSELRLLSLKKGSLRGGRIATWSATCQSQTSPRGVQWRGERQQWGQSGRWGMPTRCKEKNVMRVITCLKRFPREAVSLRPCRYSNSPVMAVSNLL